MKVLKLACNSWILWIAKGILHKNKDWVLTLLIKMLLLWQNKTHKDQWNRTTNPEINVLLDDQLICVKGTKHNGGKIMSSRNSVGKTGYMDTKLLKEFLLYNIWYPEKNLKCIKKLNIRPQTIKDLEEKNGNGPSHDSW